MFQFFIGQKSVPIFYTNSNKYWAHRVLDPQTANDLSVKFNGVELDVFFESDKSLFDVRHHGSFKDNSLIDYLSKINNNDMYFWVDLKNLDSSNVSSVITRLDLITKETILNNSNLIKNEKLESRVIHNGVPKNEFSKQKSLTISTPKRIIFF